MDPAITPEAIQVPISRGELIDKITILRIKERRMTDPAKLQHVRTELHLLERVLFAAAIATAEMHAARDRLMIVNAKLWDVEDAIRDCEKRQDFGQQFVGYARAIIHLNDERSALKRQINQLAGSVLVEEKEYSCTRPACSC